MKEFILNDAYIELVRLIKLLGYAETGGHAKLLIEQGEVKVNGQTELRKRAKLRDGDEVEISGRKIRILSSGN
ncbi:MAG: RNA-binding S4 domain-containing protein [Mariniphaga sp.]